MTIEEKILECIQKATKSSSYSVRRKNLITKKLLDFLDAKFIFLSLEGKSLSPIQQKVQIQNVITRNIDDGGGYMDEFQVADYAFTTDLCKSFIIKEKEDE